MSAVMEVVQFRVEQERAVAFVQERRKADDALASFAGFLGAELTQGSQDIWTLRVHWASRAAVEAAQAVTLSAPGVPALAAWIALAAEVVSFGTVPVHYRSQFPGGEEARNRATALRFATEGLGKADLGVFDELLDPDIVVTTGLSPAGPILGRDAYKQVFAGFAEAWPVTAFSVDECFAVADKVVVRFTAVTHFRKDYYGVPANGVIAPLKEVHVYTLRGGKISENTVGAINLPFEFTMYPALKNAVLDGLAVLPVSAPGA